MHILKCDRRRKTSNYTGRKPPPDRSRPELEGPVNGATLTSPVVGRAAAGRSTTCLENLSFPAGSIRMQRKKGYGGTRHSPVVVMHTSSFHRHVDRILIQIGIVEMHLRL